MKTPADKQQFAIFVPYNLFTEMEKIKQLQKEFSSFLETCNYMGTPSELYAPIAYTILQKGKRLRPMLCLLANDMFGGNVEDALWPALALETFHNYTLIHDDIMDNAPIRRGMPTVCRKWGDNAAILSGDAMLLVACQRMLNCSPELMPKVQNLFVETAIEICEGQQYDMDFETRMDVREEEYIEMIRLKTSVLLACATKMGAILAGAPEEDAENLYKFGEQMGLAFQLQDDYLDVYGDPKVFGKAIGGDILCNKKTYMLINALNRADEAQRQEMDRWLNAENPNPQEKIAALTRAYNNIGINKLAQEKIEHYFAESRKYLDKVNVTDERKQVLVEYTNRMMHREY